MNVPLIMENGPEWFARWERKIVPEQRYSHLQARDDVRSS